MVYTSMARLSEVQEEQGVGGERAGKGELNLASLKNSQRSALLLCSLEITSYVSTHLARAALEPLLT